MALDWFRFITLFSAITFTVLGIFVLRRDHTSRVHQVFFIYVIFLSLWSFGFFLTMFEAVPTRVALWSSRISHFFGGLTAFVFLHFAHHFLGRRDEIKPIHVVLAVGTGIGCLTPWLIVAVPTKLFFPYYPEPGVLYPILLASFVYTYMTAFKWLWTTYTNMTIAYSKRMQSLCILIGVSLAWINVATLFLPIYNIPIAPQLSLFPLIGIGTVYAIIRYQFLDIRVILRRSLVYSLLIAGITAVYLVMVLVLERWTAGFMGYRSFLATLGVAGLIAVGFNPVRDWLQTFVDRALFHATPPELATQREQLLVEVRRGEQMKAVGTLAAGLAHEIKNPLSAIKTFTEHLTSRYDDPTFRAKFQTIVGGEVERIHLIVQQLLEFAKPVPPKLAPVDVPQLLDDTISLLTSELLKHHVQVTRTYTRPARILADPQQLKQVFLNLLLNSLQAMNGSGQLTLTTTPQGSELAITIQDTGQGIAPEHLSRLGEPFFSTKPTGTGLGLAVVQSILREHQGRLAIQSQIGRGTTITIHIPLAAS